MITNRIKSNPFTTTPGVAGDASEKYINAVNIPKTGYNFFDKLLEQLEVHLLKEIGDERRIQNKSATNSDLPLPYILSNAANSFFLPIILMSPLLFFIIGIFSVLFAVNE